jgi:hypothetical protein
VDVPGGPAQQFVTSNDATDVPPSRGFLEQFQVLDKSSTLSDKRTQSTDWFPFGFDPVETVNNIVAPREKTPPGSPPDQGSGRTGPFSLVLATSALTSTGGNSPIPPDGIVGLVQGVSGVGGPEDGQLNRGFANVVFKEAQIAGPQAANFKITSLGQKSSVALKFSQDDIPSDILNGDQFIKAFTAPTPPPSTDNPTPKPLVPDPQNVVVGLKDGSGIFSPFSPVTPRKQLTIDVPAGQTITVSDPGFFAGDSPTKPGVLGQDQLKNGTLLGLAKDTLMGSVFVQPTGGGVSVEVGQRIVRRVDPISPFRVVERLVPGGFKFEPSGLGFGMFSLQAPPPSPSAAAIFRIESDGPLHISDPIFDPTTNISALADATLISKQDIAVQSVALQHIAQTSSSTPPAQTVTLVLPAVKLTQGLEYWIETSTANLRLRLQTIEIDEPNNTATATFTVPHGVTVPNDLAGALIFDQDPSLHGQLVFHNTNLNAGQGIAISSPNKIRFENSSQIQALTDVIMQGGGTADLELLQNSVVKAHAILLDQFRNITIDSAQLMASVIKARVISPTGALMINNSTLAAGSLLRLYAEGSNGKVAFSGNVNLTGKQIDIAGKTVVVQSGGKVMSNPNTTVYADTHNYNKGNFGTIKNAATNSNISSSQQKSFAARPSF